MLRGFSHNASGVRCRVPELKTRNDEGPSSIWPFTLSGLQSRLTNSWYSRCGWGTSAAPNC